MQDRKSDIKSKFVRHFLNDVQLDSGGFGFVVDSQQGYASFVLGNDGIGSDNMRQFGIRKFCHGDSLRQFLDSFLPTNWSFVTDKLVVCYRLMVGLLPRNSVPLARVRARTIIF